MLISCIFLLGRRLIHACGVGRELRNCETFLRGEEMADQCKGNPPWLPGQHTGALDALGAQADEYHEIRAD
jgi:hypothetical protein